MNLYGQTRRNIQQNQGDLHKLKLPLRLDISFVYVEPFLLLFCYYCAGVLALVSSLFLQMV